MSFILLAAIYALFIPDGLVLYGPRPNADDVRDRMVFLRPGMSSKRVESILGLRDDQMLLIGSSMSMSMRDDKYEIEPGYILTLFYTSGDGPSFEWQLTKAKLTSNDVNIATIPGNAFDLRPFNRLRRLCRPAFERALVLLPQATEKISLLRQQGAYELLTSP